MRIGELCIYGFQGGSVHGDSRAISGSQLTRVTARPGNLGIISRRV